MNYIKVSTLFFFFFRKSVCEEKGGGGAHKHALSKLNMEIRELEKDLRRQTEINEIALKECFVKTLHKSEINLSVVRAYLEILL